MAKRGGYPGMGGGMNMNNMMKQVQKMQKTDGRTAENAGRI